MKEKKGEVFDNCPHCGKKLSPWEKVLLNVDRAIVCKNCWYRILLDIREETPGDEENKNEKKT
jgi:DNA-directed RNA polymerase subunit RPC12/RpoP